MDAKLGLAAREALIQWMQGQSAYAGDWLLWWVLMLGIVAVPILIRRK